jgi:hypothetical protein
MADMNSSKDDDEPVFDLASLEPDEPVPYLPAPEPGRVDSTSMFSGVPVRVATAGEFVYLTIVGDDGMATVMLDDTDSELLSDMLAAGRTDVRRRKRGDL